MSFVFGFGWREGDGKLQVLRSFVVFRVCGAVSYYESALLLFDEAKGRQRATELKVRGGRVAPSVQFGVSGDGRSASRTSSPPEEARLSIKARLQVERVSGYAGFVGPGDAIGDDDADDFAGGIAVGGGIYTVSPGIHAAFESVLTAAREFHTIEPELEW